MKQPKCSHAFSVFLMLLFWAANVSLNVYNKWLFGRAGLRVPFFVTMSHQLFCFFGALAMSFTPFYTRRKLEAKSLVPKILGLAVFFSINTGLNNCSLLFLTLSANQVIRALLPAVCAVVAIVVEKKKLSVLQWCTLGALVLGVVLALLHNPTFNAFGTVLCGGSVLGAALHVSTAGHFLEGIRFSAFDILLYTSLPVIMILLPLFAVSTEYQGLHKFIDMEGKARFTLLVAVGGVIAFLYNLIHYLFIHYTSSVYSTVAGNMKVVLVVSVSLVLMDDDATPLNVVGLGIACCAFVLHSLLEFHLKSQNQVTPLPIYDEKGVCQPVATGDGWSKANQTSSEFVEPLIEGEPSDAPESSTRSSLCCGF
eukprot:c8330_g1_i1.p1 GENE.c8330_g1_i1~~c8330_g1_i1.p1  ORF type:complete len:367 (-),score=80.18 c8330_g1_i1:68-1168(-)